MGTGFKGTFVISWAQTEVDGVKAAPVGALTVGSSWRRLGEPMRLDGPADLLLLDGADGEADLRKRAAKSVHRLVGAALNPGYDIHDEPTGPLMDRGFVVTDGARCFAATEISTGGARPPLLMFVDDLPPANVDLWVVRMIVEAGPVTRHTDGPKGVICFASDTRISTPQGPKLLQELGEGDYVDTKDNGPQEILWTGRRHMTGARLYAMPHLRPIRVREGALGSDRPDGDLIVSPLHRMLIKGRHAQLLYNTDEVLVAAKDLINDRSVVLDTELKSVTYVHLMMDQHQILMANGVETESFHPANTSLDVLDPNQRDGLLEVYPAIAHDPFAYGDFARRNLSASEAAVLQYEAGLTH